MASRRPAPQRRPFAVRVAVAAAAGAGAVEVQRRLRLGLAREGGARRRKGGDAEEVVPPLGSQPKGAREADGRSQHARWAAAEAERVGRGAPDDVKTLLGLLGDQRWAFDGLYSGTELWRLSKPGDRITSIMGVRDIKNVTPAKALEEFKDPKLVFTKVFPKVDTMFQRGEVLRALPKAHCFCHGVFKLPNPVGGGSAPGFKARDFVWEQHVTGLPTGNVLVTAKSVPEGSKDDIPPQKNLVRGWMIAGYYGRLLTPPGAKEPPVTRVVYMVQCDPKNLPAWLINLCSGKQAQNCTRLAAMYGSD